MPIGAVVGGRFKIEAMLGRGGLGFLYRAMDVKTQKPVAIRILEEEIATDGSAVDRLREQVKTASTLQHKNISSIFGMGKEGGVRFIAFEFVDGQSLRQLLEKKRLSGRTFSLKGAYNVVAHVCNALHQAHPVMVHGLPGPGTILINRVGRIKLCDFGLAQAMGPGSAVFHRLGDCYCASPELAAGAALDPTADIYSLGVVLYELLTGSPPSQPLVPPSHVIAGIPQEVDEVVGRCLEPHPGSRFTEAQQLKAAFYAAVQSASEQAEVEGVVGSAPPPVAPLQPQRTGPPPGPLAPPPPGPLPPSPVAAPPAPARRRYTLEELMAQATEDPAEKWLIQKDRLDFGPFTRAALMQEIRKGQFTGDDVVLDQESGERTRLRQSPQFSDFVLLLEKDVAADQMVKAEQEQHQKDRRRRTMLIAIVASAFIILGAGGALTAYFLTKKPELKEKIIYKEKAGKSLELMIKGIEISWKPEPKEQADRRRKYRVKRPKKGGPVSDDVTYLGDATKEGGDAMLNQSAIQRVMSTSYRQLVPCIGGEKRRTPSLSEVTIDFGIRGSGDVTTVKVNGQSGGSFQACIHSKMQRIKFPSFDGSLTRASFSMQLK